MPWWHTHALILLTNVIWYLSKAKTARSDSAVRLRRPSCSRCSVEEVVGQRAWVGCDIGRRCSVDGRYWSHILPSNPRGCGCSSSPPIHHLSVATNLQRVWADASNMGVCKFALLSFYLFICEFFLNCFGGPFFLSLSLLRLLILSVSLFWICMFVSVSVWLSVCLYIKPRSNVWHVRFNFDGVMRWWLIWRALWDTLSVKQALNDCSIQWKMVRARGWL